MEVNKEEAVRCRDLGANALRGGQNARAVKMFAKSLHLYPLPGVKALLGQAERRVRAEEEGGTASTNNGNGTRTGTGNGTGNGASHSNSGGRSSSSSASADAAARPASSTPTWAQLAQFLPILVILALSFLNRPGGGRLAKVKDGSRYFSLTPVKPHTNPQATRLAKVKDIPYFVSDQFLRTVARDRYQLSQVERMVEKSYEKYLVDECKSQRAYKRKLEAQSTRSKGTDAERADLARRAGGFEPTRCAELEDLFPRGGAKKDGAARHGEF